MKPLLFVIALLLSNTRIETSPQNRNGVHFPWFYDADNYWDFDIADNNTVQDLRGGRRSRIIGNYKIFPGPKDNALEFLETRKHSKSYVILGDFSDTCLPDPGQCHLGFTISFWVNLRKVLHDGVLLQLAMTRRSRGITVNTLYKKGKVFLIFYGNTHAKTYSIKAELSSHIWHHIALVWNATAESKLSLFINCTTGDEFKPKINGLNNKKRGHKNLILGANHSGKKAIPIAVDDFAIWFNVLKSERFCEMINQRRVHGNYSSWTEFTSCSVTCGLGVKSRKRMCNNPIPDYGGRNCSEIGPSLETVKCVMKRCPIAGGYTLWSGFSECTVSCGSGGTRFRTRNCTNPKPEHGGPDCSGIGSGIEILECDFTPCPISGGYTPWSNFSVCTVSCGSGGTRFRTRNCTNPKPQYGGQNCSIIGRSLHIEHCAITPCPIHGNYSAWSAFSPCSTSCGYGYKIRNRTCSDPVPKYGGRNCSGLGYETMSCNLRECPVHGGYSQWSNFSVCSQTCGNVTRVRTRICNNPSPRNGGRDCKDLGSNLETVPCKTLPCPLHGAYSDWSVFPCFKTCGNSSRYRRRFCTNPAPRYGGKNCSALGHDFEIVPCYQAPCPVHGNFSEWSEFSKCSCTCGNCERRRYRNCSRPTPMHGGNNCSSLGPSVDIVNCDVRQCPVNGNYSEWSTFSTCSQTCGNGTQFRSRQCNNPSPRFGGMNCSIHGRSNQTRQCNTHSCPIHGNFSEWSNFTDCSETCGFGVKMRYRHCNNPDPQFGGDDCSELGPSFNIMPCDVVPCPIHGNYSTWSSFGPCSKSCDNGTQIRRRFCTNPSPAFGGQSCARMGLDMETRPCETHSCPDIDFMVKFKLKDIVWNNALRDNSTKVYQSLKDELTTAILGLHKGKAIKEIKILQYSQGSVMATIEVIYYSLDFPGAMFLYDALYNDRRLGAYDLTPILFTSTDVPTNFVQNLTASNRSSTSLALHWSALSSQPGQTDILGYFVFYETLTRTSDVMSDEAKIAVFLNTTDGRLDGLKKYSWYRIRISGMNRRGVGVPSDPLIVLTNEDVPNSSLSLTPVGYNTSSTSLNISWKAIPKDDINGILRGYAIFYKPATSHDHVKNVTVPPNKTTAHLTDLRKYTEYELNVAGITSKGVGGLSAGSLVYTVPSASPEFRSFGNRSSTSIEIQWKIVKDSHQNGVILGYRVYFKPSVSNGDWNVIVVKEGNTSLVVKNLKKYTEYSFRISAFTSKGEGNVSESISVSTDEDVPCSAPLHLEASAINSTALLVKWQKLSISCYHGILRGYVVYYLRKGESQYRNKVVPPSRSEAVLSNLDKFTMYLNITVAGFTAYGNGPLSQPVFVRTAEDVPSAWPQDIRAYNRSSTTIEVSWNQIPHSKINGRLRGYNLYIRKANESEWDEKSGKHSVSEDVFNGFHLIDNLWKYTKYVLSIAGYTTVGEGVRSPEIAVWTDEDVPSRAPEQFKAINKSSPSSIRLSWKPISDPFYVHGILLGYKIEFQMTHLAGNRVYKSSKIVATGANSMSYVLSGLAIYAVYTINIQAFTVKGDGISAQVSAETCMCASVYKTNWWINPPYIYKNNSRISGIFPNILPRMVSSCCGFCLEHTKTVTRFENRVGETSFHLKSGVSEFRQHVDDRMELHFPMYGQVHQTKYYKRYEFIPLVKSPGVIFLVLDDDVHVGSKMLLRTIVNTFPIVVLILALSSVVGIFIWCVESFSNKSQFPRPFFPGIYQGVWLAFVSMTSIGYGDKFPRSVAGRIIDIFWILIGCIFVSMYSAIVTSNLTIDVVSEHIKLYGMKVAVIQNSSEHQLAVRKNARPDLERPYNTLNDIYQALLKRDVEAALIDSYVLGSRKDLFDKIGVRINKIYDYSSAYGVVLAGEAMKMRKCFREYVNENRKDIFQIVEENINTIEESEVRPSVKRAMSLIDPTFIAYKKCVFICAFLFCLAFLMGILFEHLKKPLKRNLCRAKFITADAPPKIFAIHTSLKYEMREELMELKTKLERLKSKHRREIKQWVKLKKSARPKRRASEDSLLFSTCAVRYDDSRPSPLLQFRKFLANGGRKLSTGSSNEEETKV